MNTVVRTLGGAVGGQIAATFVAGSTLHGLPELTGFTKTFGMAAVFLALGVGAAVLVPVRKNVQAKPQADGVYLQIAEPR
jgi:hypothetical protein